MSKEHAIHNEEVCDFLLSSDKYYDWVVTTAFYSALHYIRYEIFPYEEAGRTFYTIDQYYEFRKGDRRISKHKVLLDLTKLQAYSCYSYFKILHDTCFTARYVNYKVSREIAVQSRTYLEKLKRQLTKAE